MPGHRLTYLTAPDCPFCDEGRQLVRTLADETGFELVEQRWDSLEAATLLERQPAFFPPAAYLDEQLLGYGRLSARRLRRLLAKAAV